MPKSVGLDQWKEQIARSKRLNKKIAEEQATNTKEEVATDEAPEVAPVTDSIEVTVNEPSTEVTEPQVEVTAEAPVVETTNDEVAPESEPTSEVPGEEVYEAIVAATTDTTPVVEENIASEYTESTVTDNDNSSDTISNFGSFESKPLFKHGRIDKSNTKYKGIQQESLRSFCNEALLKGDIPEQIVLQCGIIRKKL